MKALLPETYLIYFVLGFVNCEELFKDQSLRNVENNTFNEDPNRIVGGKEAIPNQFPYQVSLSILMESRLMQICGGVLISESWVLTAAHCLYKASMAWAYLGAHDTSNYGETTQKKITVHKSNFIIHSNYPVSWTDIALLKFPLPVAVNKVISPIALPCVADKKNNFVGKNVLVSGWGMTSDTPGSMPQKLKYTNIQIISSNVCTKFFGPELTVDPENILCATGYKGRSACSGDSGGPMVSTTKDGKVKLIGIVSFGTIGGCTKGHPQGFVRVSSYLNWIKEKTLGGIKAAFC